MTVLEEGVKKLNYPVVQAFASTNQIVLGGGQGGASAKTTISSIAPASSKVATIPALSADDSFSFISQAQTFTNKKFNTSSCNFSDNSDATKLLAVSVASNGTGRKGTLSFAVTSTDKIYTFPNTSGTVLLSSTIGSTSNTFSVDQNFLNGGIVLDTVAGAGGGFYMGNTGFYIVDFALGTSGTAVELDFTGANRYCSINLTSAGALVSIRSIKSDDSYHIITNKTGASVTLINNGTPTAGSAVLTSYGSDIVIPNNGTVILNKDLYLNVYRVFGGVYTIPNVIYSGGALGTPSSGVATNLTGTASSLTSGITNALKSATTTVDVSAATAPSNGQALIATDSTHATWQTITATLPSGSVTLLGDTGIISAVASGTTQMPYDDTIPQSSEGDQYMSVTVTPTNASNSLIIIATINYSNSSGAAACCAALFQDSTAGSLNAVGGNISGGSIPGQMMIIHKMTAGTTSATTFKVRAGPSGAQTLTFNGASGARKFGGVMGSSILVYEVKA